MLNDPSRMIKNYEEQLSYANDVKITPDELRKMFSYAIQLESKLAKAREALKHISSDGDKMPDCCCDAGELLSNHYDKVAREALKEIE